MYDSSTSLCSHIFLVLMNHGVYMYVVYIWKWSTAHVLGGVSGVALFITADEQLQYNRGCCFLVQAMLPGGFPFHQFIILIACTILRLLDLLLHVRLLDLHVVCMYELSMHYCMHDSSTYMYNLCSYLYQYILSNILGIAILLSWQPFTLKFRMTALKSTQCVFVPFYVVILFVLKVKT